MSIEMSEFMREKEDSSEELAVQQVVVESLAADKAELDERIAALEKENAALKKENEALKAETNSLQEELEPLKSQVEELKGTLAKMGDRLAENAEGELSNKVALLDREMEVSDRFEGETRDHVLEVIAEARAKAEQEGRQRRAQLLESVLLANAPTGNLSKRREDLKRLFEQNENILSGPVIEELERRGISHKKGEEYLLVGEILKRTY